MNKSVITEGGYIFDSVSNFIYRASKIVILLELKWVDNGLMLVAGKCSVYESNCVKIILLFKKQQRKEIYLLQGN